MKDYVIISKKDKGLFWNGVEWVKGFVLEKDKKNRKKKVTVFKGSVFKEDNVQKTPLPINGLWIEYEQAEYLHEKSIFDFKVAILQKRREKDMETILQKRKFYSLKEYKDIDKVYHGG